MNSTNFNWYIDEYTKKIVLCYSLDNWKTQTIIDKDFYLISDVNDYIINFIREYKVNNILQK